MTHAVHWQRDEYDIYIGRPSLYGNPFTHQRSRVAKWQVTTRDEAIKRFAEWVIQQPYIMTKIPELRGLRLGCWCHPRACHGDVLAALADDRPWTLHDQSWRFDQGLWVAA